MSVILYRLTILVIRVVKWLELQFWKCVGAEKIVTNRLKNDGIIVNGNRPWDIIVHDKSFFPRIMCRGTLAMGETFMEGLWDSRDKATLVSKVMRGQMYKDFMNPWNRFINYMEVTHFNIQTKDRAWEVGKKHYDLGNDLFKSMLDSSMNYSCGYWKDAKNLEEAQQNKMELIAKKLNLSEGMSVLDIGCGWGGLAHHLASKYKVKVVGLTISEEQAALAREKCAGLDVDIRLQDYRDVKEQFDRIVSVGMFEHVGWRNYPIYFKTAHKCLKDDGIFLLHTIAVNHYHMPKSEAWLTKYIFPNATVPFPKDIVRETEKLFIIEDWQNFGFSYSKTLKAWNDKFEESWPKLEDKYGKEFYRMWSYYLSSCEGIFDSRHFQLWQIVLSKNGLQGEYYAGR